MLFSHETEQVLEAPRSSFSLFLSLSPPSVRDLRRDGPHFMHPHTGRGGAALAVVVLHVVAGDRCGRNEGFHTIVVR